MYGLGVYLADLAQKSHRYVREPELRSVSGGPTPASGVGATIHCIDGEVWGRVVGDNGNCWQLESGRVAKKATEGARWYWATSGGAARLPAAGVGACIVGADWTSWWCVVGDEGPCWRLASGRIAKKENEGIRWWWEDASENEYETDAQRPVYSMLWCRVCLGSPY